MSNDERGEQSHDWLCLSEHRIRSIPWIVRNNVLSLSRSPSRTERNPTGHLHNRREWNRCSAITFFFSSWSRSSWRSRRFAPRRFNVFLRECLFFNLYLSLRSWEKVVLKDTDAVQAIYHSPLLTTMVSDRSGIHIDFHNATGYVLEIRTGLMDICTRLRQPHARSFETSYCKRTIARPAIGTLFFSSLFDRKQRRVSFRFGDRWSDLLGHRHCLH